jgi:hypothetical protein
LYFIVVLHAIDNRLFGQHARRLAHRLVQLSWNGRNLHDGRLQLGHSGHLGFER